MQSKNPFIVSIKKLHTSLYSFSFFRLPRLTVFLIRLPVVAGSRAVIAPDSALKLMSPPAADIIALFPTAPMDIFPGSYPASETLSYSPPNAVLAAAIWPAERFVAPTLHFAPRVAALPPPNFLVPLRHPCRQQVT